MKRKLCCILLVCTFLMTLTGCEGSGINTGNGDGRPADDVATPVVLPAKEPRPVKDPNTDVKVDPDEDSDVSTGGVAEDPSSVNGNTEDPPVRTPTGGTDINPYWFEDTLQEFLSSNDKWSTSSYMVSPASFRAALCLAIEGASGDTRETLMHAAGFLQDGDMEQWYSSLLERQSEFLEHAESMKAFGMDTGMGFDIANGIWDNASIPGAFQQNYMESIANKYGATAGSSSADKITADVNAWCSEKTHGMIQSISPDLSKVSSVLANALYVKSSWRETFEEYATEAGQFTKSDGSTVDLDFMWQTEDFMHYRDVAGREYALFPLEGDLWLTVCLDTGARVQDMLHAMYNANIEHLQVKMPKLDMETTLDGGELLSFLDQQGAGVALSDFADFSAMTDLPEGWHIGDIIQKTRIKTDEDGLEAAAVTAIMMVDNMAVMEPVTPTPFYMDNPFSFMITAGINTSDSSATILFFGQYLGV